MVSPGEEALYVATILGFMHERLEIYELTIGLLLGKKE